MALGVLLVDIATRTGFALHLDADGEGAVSAALATVTFDHVTVDEALGRVLRGRNFTVEYSDGRVRTVIVYGNGRGRSVVAESATRTNGAALHGDGGRAATVGESAGTAVTLERKARLAREPAERARALGELGDGSDARDVAVVALDQERDEGMLDVARTIGGSERS